MFEHIANSADSIILYSFYALFFITPLLLTPFNYELFEFNKMLAVYAFSAVITGSWLLKMIANKKIIFKRTPIDIPLLLFLLALLLSTLFSIDRHVSIWGYYSRFNGGLTSIISYLLLYFAFVTNFPKDKITTLLKVTLASAVLISLFGVAEHFGIDRHIWVQDVQNRVFSTLGQPNWLAAYLVILIPISVGIGLSHLSTISGSNVRIQNSEFSNQKFFRIGSLVYWIIGALLYLTLIFTKSRSGFIGFWIGDTVFWLLLFLHFKKSILKFFFIFNISLLIFNFFFGAPFSQLNRFTLPELTKSAQPQPTTNPSTSSGQTTNTGGSLIDVGITESGTIRNIVWKGAIEVMKNNPLLGTGPETFAFSYYKYRPKEHNMTSEWDFLYNKAHNEFLNYGATTGLLGLGSYLSIIITFIVWFIKNSKFEYRILLIGLFAGWTTIHVTNFFGFSVVVVQLFFFLIPAIAFLLTGPTNDKRSTTKDVFLSASQKIIIFFILLSTSYILFSIVRFWYADKLFASGFSDAKAQKYSQSFTALSDAISVRSDVPLFHDELTLPAAVLSAAFWESGETTTSAQLATESINASNIAIARSTSNVNFWKSRTRLFYTLSRIDEKYLDDALISLEQAHILAPTDPKITYNLGLLYDQAGKTEEAYQILEKTTELKLDYRDAYFALGLFYIRDKQPEKARESFEFILNRINPNDEEVKQKLKELG